MVSRVLRSLVIYAALGRAFCEDDDFVGKEEDLELSDGHLRQAHEDLDTNNDNKISHQELLDFAHKHHRDVEFGVRDMEEELRRMDVSGDGKITLEDFLKDSSNHAMDRESQAYQDLRAEKQAFFSSADKDGDGVIDKQELPALLSALHDQVLDTVIKHSLQDGDSDNDGKMNPDEFSKSWMYKRFHQKVYDDGLTSPVEKSKQLFERLDSNHDGLLDTQELRPMESGTLSHEVMVEKFVNKVDKDGDRHIDVDELASGKHHISDDDIQDYLIAWAKRRRIAIV